jgi:hypothetical protein
MTSFGLSGFMAIFHLKKKTCNSACFTCPFPAPCRTRPHPSRFSKHDAEFILGWCLDYIQQTKVNSGITGNTELEYISVSRGVCCACGTPGLRAGSRSGSMSGLIPEESVTTYGLIFVLPFTLFIIHKPGTV